MAFTLNGELQGVAYADVLEGTYYPAASLYTLPQQAEGATVRFNFGPDFKFAPPQVSHGGGRVRPGGAPRPCVERLLQRQWCACVCTQLEDCPPAQPVSSLAQAPAPPDAAVVALTPGGADAVEGGGGGGGMDVEVVGAQGGAAMDVA